ncbi:MAG TPA: MMPL family transporter [Acidimicrobiales bacterium]|nr:MMPL family transporter [Acidimicrobiales bacterium]
MLERWTRFVVRWRAVVLVFWAVVAVLGLLAASNLPARLTSSLNVPGSDSARANHILARDFGQNIEGTFTVVVPVTRRELVKSVEAKIATAATVIPTSRIREEEVAGNVLYANVDTSLDLNHAAPDTATLRHALLVDGVTGALVTGPPAFQYDITPVLTNDLHRGELVALVVALVLLLVVLGLCWAVLIPFVTAVAIATGSLAIIYLIAQHFLMVLYIPNLIELIGLGLAMDYSLLSVHRFRAELRETNATTLDAVIKTMSTAGRTVLFSGFAVAISLATLLVVPVPFVRSLGAAGLVVPLVALAATFSLQPVLLSLLGRRGTSPVGPRGLLVTGPELGATWSHVARRVIARPVTVLVVSLALLGGASSLTLWLQLTPASETAIPQHLQSTRALALVRAKVGAGVITPTEIVVDTGRRGGANSAIESAARLRLATMMLHRHESFVVAIGSRYPFVDGSRRFEQLVVVTRHDFGDESTQHFVSTLRDELIPAAKFPEGTRVFVGGAGAQGVDFLSRVYDAFPWIVLMALLLAFFVLVRAFRSLVVALVAVLLNVLSVAAAYGLMVVVFRFGVGSSILHTYRVSQIEGWVPVFIFAVLFGLSTDYEVFITSRIREAWDDGLSNDDAIITGVARTGGVVTAAALILVGAMSGLVFGHVAGLQELGVGLSLGVLVDATLVRCLLLPSIIALVGARSWWLPARVATLLRVPPSPLETRGETVTHSLT